VIRDDSLRLRRGGNLAAEYATAAASACGNADLLCFMVRYRGALT